MPAHRNFLAQDPIYEWLRLRQTKNGCTINYKNWHNNEDRRAISADEYETEINDLGVMRKILEALDFKEVIVVEKKRTTWQYKKTEIAIDNVTDLGFFIEIEANGSFKDIKKVKKYLYEILSELEIKVGEQDFVGYPFLLLQKFSAT